MGLNEENKLNAFYHWSGWFIRMFSQVGFTNDAFLSGLRRVCQGGMVAPSWMHNTFLSGKQGLLVLSGLGTILHCQGGLQVSEGVSWPLFIIGGLCFRRNPRPSLTTV